MAKHRSTRSFLVESLGTLAMKADAQHSNLEPYRPHQLESVALGDDAFA
jgi:hypothetical protein